MTTTKTTRTRTTYHLYRVLMAPDHVSYVYGILASSTESMLASTPIVWHEGKAVAILDERSYVEQCISNGKGKPSSWVMVYGPADYTWLPRHPTWWAACMGRDEGVA